MATRGGMSSAPDPAHFNADALAAAYQAPTLTVGRLLYVGELLSIEDWLPWFERLQDLEKRQLATKDESAEANLAKMAERSAFFRDYLYAVFPRRKFRRPFWAPDPVAVLTKKPYEVVQATVAFFFILQARATFGDKPTPTTQSPQPGTPSPEPTAGAPAAAP